MWKIGAIKKHFNGWLRNGDSNLKQSFKNLIKLRRDMRCQFGRETKPEKEFLLFVYI